MWKEYDSKKFAFVDFSFSEYFVEGFELANESFRRRRCDTSLYYSVSRNRSNLGILDNSDFSPERRHNPCRWRKPPDRIDLEFVSLEGDTIRNFEPICVDLRAFNSRFILTGG